jgi:hypothetical protein
LKSNGDAEFRHHAVEISRTVDAADYVVWRKGVGVASTPENYNLWRTTFGRTSGGSGSAASDAVPEPATALLLLFAVAGRFIRQRSF